MSTADDGEATGSRAHAEAAEPRGQLLYTLDVDGEVFEVRVHDDGTDYDWVSGPNKDYGFGSGGGQNMTEDEHRAIIRSFLSMIDPTTGYIAED